MPWWDYFSTVDSGLLSFQQPCRSVERQCLFLAAGLLSKKNNIWVYYLFPDRKKNKYDCHLILRLIRIDIPLRSNFRMKMWHFPLETIPLLKFRLKHFGSTPGSSELHRTTLSATYGAPSVDQSVGKLPVNCVWLLLSRRWTCSSDAFHLGQLAAHWKAQKSRQGWRERL